VPVKYLERLYLASAGDLIATLQMLDDSVRHELVIGHNPGLLEAVDWLMADALHEKDIRQLTRKFPTATLADLTLSLGQWRDLAPASATLARVLIGREVPELREPKRA
jgi:phosphohistidine phosphatase